VIAHLGGVPLEELLPSVTGAGTGLLLARGWLMVHLRRRRAPLLVLKRVEPAAQEDHGVVEHG
jgi:hypothetical protein